MTGPDGAIAPSTALRPKGESGPIRRCVIVGPLKNVDETSRAGARPGRRSNDHALGPRRHELSPPSARV